MNHRVVRVLAVDFVAEDGEEQAEDGLVVLINRGGDVLMIAAVKLYVAEERGEFDAL
jgi:hypothetical protein